MNYFKILSGVVFALSVTGLPAAASNLLKPKFVTDDASGVITQVRDLYGLPATEKIEVSYMDFDGNSISEVLVRFSERCNLAGSCPYTLLYVDQGRNWEIFSGSGKDVVLVPPAAGGGFTSIQLDELRWSWQGAGFVPEVIGATPLNSSDAEDVKEADKAPARAAAQFSEILSRPKFYAADLNGDGDDELIIVEGDFLEWMGGQDAFHIVADASGDVLGTFYANPGSLMQVRGNVYATTSEGVISLAWTGQSLEVGSVHSSPELRPL